jgi:putative phosphoribosyl transferase
MAAGDELTASLAQTEGAASTARIKPTTALATIRCFTDLAGYYGNDSANPPRTLRTAMKLRHTEVGLPAGENWLDGILAHSPAVPGLVIVAERSGSTLATSRSAFINGALQHAGFATLHLGLLSHDEERHAPDTWHQVSTLATRLTAVLEWIRHQPALKELPIGIVSRESAAAAMIRVAARNPEQVRALASRGGRPDLAGMEPLRELTLPLLLVAGELDNEAGAQNRQVHELLTGPNELVVVHGASHGFEEPGTLDLASRHIVRWFRRWISGEVGPTGTLPKERR